LGSVTSIPDGLQCSVATCTRVVAPGTQVNLTETPITGAFLGWSEDCAGFGSCSVTLDQDRMVGAQFGASGEGLWVVQIGGTGYERGYSIATASDGNLSAVGQFEGTVQVGQQSIASHGSTDIYVAKVDSTNGNVLWAKAIGGANGEAAFSVALDSTDNIYIAGDIRRLRRLRGGNVLSGFGANGRYS
jgi:hypothetical protein